MIEFLFWLLLGGIAGWIASIIVGKNSEMGIVHNILAGVAGAVVGGWLVEALTDREVEGFNLGSLVVAVLGAVLVLWVLNYVLRVKRDRNL